MTARNYTTIFCDLKNKRRGNLHKIGYEKQNGITWDEASQHRPPLRIDMSGPTPTRYNIDKNCAKYASTTSSPAFSFGRKCTNISALAAADCKSVSPFIVQTTKNDHNPSPSAYNPAQTMGQSQPNYPSAPAFSIGPEVVKERFFNLEGDLIEHESLNLQKRHSGGKHTMAKRKKNKGEGEYIQGNLYKVSCEASRNLHHRNILKMKKQVNPSATTYSPTKSEKYTMRRAPAFSMAKSITKSGFLGNAQRAAREVPACNLYNPLISLHVSKVKSAEHKISGERRYKRHDTGPFATL